MLQNNNSLAISLTGNIGSIKNLNSENYLRAGTGGNSHNLFYPQFSDPNIHKNETIKEFQDLITSNPTENKLEKFIEKYFQEIFGSKYDRIETQLLLNFPELDINDKTRKLDVFLHNSISSDWELFELKKVIPLTKTYRDIQTLSSEIYSSIQQIKNYERLLKQNQIKESLKKDGIEYFEPNLHLVVGRTPIISTEKWRWLVNSNGDVKIITYDDLIEEMKIRQKDRIDYYHSVQIIDDKK